MGAYAVRSQPQNTYATAIAAMTPVNSANNAMLIYDLIPWLYLCKNRIIADPNSFHANTPTQ